MRVHVLYFAGLRDLAGHAEEDLDLPGPEATVRAVARAIADHRPHVGARLASVRFAVNEVFAEMDDTVADGAVVALIPPVAGG